MNEYEQTTTNAINWDGRERRAVQQQRMVSTTLGVLVPIIGLALAFLVQFGGSIWWGATLSSDMRHLTETVARLEGERYTKSDAQRDIQRLEQRDTILSDQIIDVKAKQARLEERADNRSDAMIRSK